MPSRISRRCSTTCFLKLERRNSIRKQATDLRVRVVHDRTNALPGKNIGRGKACRPRANDADALSGIDDVRHVRAPALLQGLVGYVLLDATDRHCADTVIERARAFAEPVLWTDATADLRQ